MKGLKIFGEGFLFKGFRFGLRFKLLVLSLVTTLLFGFLISLYYQNRLEEEFFSFQRQQLTTELKILTEIGQSYFQEPELYLGPMERVFSPYFRDPHFRMIYVAESKEKVFLSRISNPALEEWWKGFTLPKDGKEFSLKTRFSGETLIVVGIPVVSLAKTLEGLEALGGLLGESSIPSQGGGQEVEKSRIVWVILGVSGAVIQKQFSQLRFNLLGYTIPLLLVALLIVYGVTGILLRPMEQMLSTTQEMAKGRVGRKMEILSEDEIGELADSFNAMVTYLSHFFVEIKEASSKLNRVTALLGKVSEEIRKGSESQSEAVEEVAASVEEMKRSITEIERNSEEMQQSVEEASSSVEQMSKAIGDVTEQMRHLEEGAEKNFRLVEEFAGFASQIRTLFQSFDVAVEDTTSAMAQVNQSTENIQERTTFILEDVRELRSLSLEGNEQYGILGSIIQKSFELSQAMEGAVQEMVRKNEEVVKIIRRIQEIADQTNLLALNASIIATRTGGEEGSSFNVIAREIKSLSDRTQDSLKEIVRYMEEVRKEGERSHQIVREVKTKIGEGEEQVRTFQKALTQIDAKTVRLAEALEVINVATRNQREGSEAVKKRLEEISKEMEEARKNLERWLLRSGELKSIAEETNNVARLVGKFLQEHEQGSRVVVSGIERTLHISREIGQSLSDQKKAMERISESIERVREQARAYTELIHGEFNEGIQTVLDELRRFHTLVSSLQMEE
jgi:methyl-accepting chemotaxis protein